MTPSQPLSCRHSDPPGPLGSENARLLSVDSTEIELPEQLRPELQRSESSGEEDKDTSNPEHFVYQAGCHFFLVQGPWIRSGEDVFDTNANTSNHYKAVERLKDDCQRWLRRQFMKGLDTQQHQTAAWIRFNCSSILGVSEGDLLNPDVRNTKFREEIGWVNETGLYSSSDVPILHKDWQGKYSLSSIFLNPKLMGIYVALIYGLGAGKGFVNGEPLQSQTETVSQHHKIRNTTPGAIATCAVLARWVLSADDTLQEVGPSTGIHYFDNFENYLIIIETGLRQKKTSVLNIIKQWDERIFPIESSRVQRAMALLLADSEGEDDEMDGQGGNGWADRSIASLEPVVM